MFVEERHEKILSILQAENRCKVLDLVERLNASEATIRRDLQELEQLGLLKRTHGGAMLNFSTSIEQTFVEKEITRLDEKKYIGQKAALHVKDSDIIILDSGTTVLQMIPYLVDKKITVITNSIGIANTLGAYENIHLIMLGGQYRSITRAVVGSFANDMLANLHADKAFMGTNAIDQKHGATTPNPEEAKTKRTMIEVSDEAFVLADHSKFNLVTLAKFADLSDLSGIITSCETPDSVLLPLHKCGIKIFQ